MTGVSAGGRYGPRAAALAACADYRLDLGAAAWRGDAGNLLTENTGASVEFKDFRAYVPGDDIRRLDWAAYARSGEPVMRLFKDERSPCVDVIIDGSASMRIDDGRKPELALEMGEFLLASSREQGFKARAWVVTDSGLRPLDGFQSLAFEGRSRALFEAPRELAARLPPQGLRLLLSDFLVPGGQAEALRALASGATELAAVMILGPWEAEPVLDGDQSLVDAELADRASLSLSASADGRAAARVLSAYKGRLRRIEDGLRDGCWGLGGRFARLVADAPLSTVLRRDAMAASPLAARVSVSLVQPR